jgi:hypothetical protein
LSSFDAIGSKRLTQIASEFEREPERQGLAHTLTTSRGAIDATGTDEASWQRDRRVDVTLGEERSGIN